MRSGESFSIFFRINKIPIIQSGPIKAATYIKVLIVGYNTASKLFIKDGLIPII